MRSSFYSECGNIVSLRYKVFEKMRKGMEIHVRENAGTNFSDLYCSVRDKESRLLSDQQVVHLPDIESGHIHRKEWAIRKNSALKLLSYLNKKNRRLTILEIGCGNGWLSSLLATIPNSKVKGLDINTFEVEQARRVFKKDNLSFTTEAFELDTFQSERFDIIVFAASIQYFPSLEKILAKAIFCLAADGEIHLIDTHFYKPKEVKNASKRSAGYYEKLGCPEMSAFYFHHTLTDLKEFNYRVLINPSSLYNRVFRKEPFYWIKLDSES